MHHWDTQSLLPSCRVYTMVVLYVGEAILLKYSKCVEVIWIIFLYKSVVYVKNKRDIIRKICEHRSLEFILGYTFRTFKLMLVLKYLPSGPSFFRSNTTVYCRKCSNVISKSFTDFTCLSTTLSVFQTSQSSFTLITFVSSCKRKITAKYP